MSMERLRRQRVVVEESRFFSHLWEGRTKLLYSLGVHDHVYLSKVQCILDVEQMERSSIESARYHRARAWLDAIESLDRDVRQLRILVRQQHLFATVNLATEEEVSRSAVELEAEQSLAHEVQQCRPDLFLVIGRYWRIEAAERSSILRVSCRRLIPWLEHSETLARCATIEVASSSCQNFHSFVDGVVRVLEVEEVARRQVQAKIRTESGPIRLRFLESLEMVQRLAIDESNSLWMTSQCSSNRTVSLVWLEQLTREFLAKRLHAHLPPRAEVLELELRSLIATKSMAALRLQGHFFLVERARIAAYESILCYEFEERKEVLLNIFATEELNFADSLGHLEASGFSVIDGCSPQQLDGGLRVLRARLAQLQQKEPVPQPIGTGSLLELTGKSLLSDRFDVVDAFNEKGESNTVDIAVSHSFAHTCSASDFTVFLSGLSSKLGVTLYTARRSVCSPSSQGPAVARAVELETAPLVVGSNAFEYLWQYGSKVVVHIISKVAASLQHKVEVVVEPQRILMYAPPLARLRVGRRLMLLNLASTRQETLICSKILTVHHHFKLHDWTEKVSAAAYQFVKNNVLCLPTVFHAPVQCFLSNCPSTVRFLESCVSLQIPLDEVLDHSRFGFTCAHNIGTGDEVMSALHAGLEGPLTLWEYHGCVQKSIGSTTQQLLLCLALVGGSLRSFGEYPCRFFNIPQRDSMVQVMPILLVAFSTSGPMDNVVCPKISRGDGARASSMGVWEWHDGVQWNLLQTPCIESMYSYQEGKGKFGLSWTRESDGRLQRCTVDLDRMEQKADGLSSVAVRKIRRTTVPMIKRRAESAKRKDGSLWVLPATSEIIFPLTPRRPLTAALSPPLQRVHNNVAENAPPHGN